MCIYLVSVSSRSYILSYAFKTSINATVRPVTVSVSSRSYILSYGTGKKGKHYNLLTSFRLLSELYSLLFLIKIFHIINSYLSFRLLSELYSLLLGGIEL